MTMTYLNAEFKATPDQIALSYIADAVWQDMSYQEFNSIVTETQKFLQKFGVTKRDRVFIVAENHAKWLPVFVAIVSYGAIAVPIDPGVTNSNFLDMLNDSKPKLLFVSKLLEDRITLNFSDITFTSILANFYCDLIQARGDIKPAMEKPSPPDINDPAMIVYTSGTTDKPKGIIHTHANVIAALEYTWNFGHIESSDVMLNVLPFSHIFGLVNNGLAALYNGCRIILSPTYDPLELVGIMNDYQVTFTSFFPKLAAGFLKVISATGTRFESLTVTMGGSACPESIITGLRALNITTGFGYGLTETCGGICVNFDQEPSNIGTPIEGIEFKLRNVSDNIGELCVRCPMLFTGIYGRNEDFQALWEDGWFITGDMAKLNSNGSYQILGRRTDVIKTAEKIDVFPDVLENKLGQLPFFKEYAITGFKKEDGAQPVIVAVPDSTYFTRNGIEDINKFVKDYMVKRMHEWPVSEQITDVIHLNEPLPRSYSMKVQRNLLADFVHYKTEYERIDESSSAEEKLILEIFNQFKPKIAEHLNLSQNELTIYKPMGMYRNLDALSRLSLLAYFQHSWNLELDEVTNDDFTTFYSFIRMLLRSNSSTTLLKATGKGGRGLPVPAPLDLSEKGVLRRHKVLEEMTGANLELFRKQDFEGSEDLRGNIEYLIGYTKLPIGVVGPLTINGQYAQGDFYLPLSTSEGALCASIGRGAKVITNSGGAEVRLLADSQVRSPVFIFGNIDEMIKFTTWVEDNFERIKEVAQSTTSHGKLLKIEPYCFSTQASLRFVFSTGEASGQNMTTISTHKCIHWINENYPGTIKEFLLECNLSGDKKVNMLNFISNRGKKVIARARISGKVIRNYLKTTPERMWRAYDSATMGSIQAGAIGSQAHFSNPITAIYIACGQDAACAAESAVGITHIEMVENDLVISVTLPDIMVGTVGGGTNLPTQSVCLDLLGCRGPNSAKKLAEIIAGACLAAEISLIGSMAADDFARAHAIFGRGKKKNKERLKDENA